MAALGPWGRVRYWFGRRLSSWEFAYEDDRGRWRHGESHDGLPDGVFSASRPSADRLNQTPRTQAEPAATVLGVDEVEVRRSPQARRS